MKKILLTALTASLLVCFSSAGWCSVVGDWDMEGKLSVKVKAKGLGSQNMKEYVVDEFSFYPNGDFEMINAEGEWTQAKNKFIVVLDYDALEEFYEDYLGGLVDVSVVEAKMSGTESKNGTIKAKFKIKMTFYNDDADLFGTIQAQASLKGTRADGFESVPAEQGVPSQFKNTVLEAVQRMVESATLGRK